MNTVEISVLVPIFRIEKYLPTCIESLLNQSFQDFELLLWNACGHREVSHGRARQT